MYAVNTPSANYGDASRKVFVPTSAPRSNKSTGPSWIIPVLSFLISVFLTLLLAADAVFAQGYYGQADVKVEIESNRERAENGQMVEFTITATNLGPAAAPQVWVWFDTYDTDQCFEPTEITDGYGNVTPVAYGQHLPFKWGANLGAPTPSGNDWIFASETFKVKGKVVCDPKFWFSGNARITEINGAVDPDLSNNGPAVAEVHNTKADLNLEVFPTRARLVKVDEGSRFDLDTGAALAPLDALADLRLLEQGAGQAGLKNPGNSSALLAQVAKSFEEISFADIADASFAASNLSGVDLEDAFIVRSTEGDYFKVGHVALGSGTMTFEYEQLFETEPKPKEDIRFRVKLTNLGPDRSRNIKVLIEEDDPHGCFVPSMSLNPATTSGVAVPVNPFGPMNAHLSLEDHATYYPFPVVWKLTLVRPDGPHKDIFDMEFVEISGTIACGDDFGIKAKVIDEGTAADHSPQGYVSATVEGAGNADLQITKEVVSFDADKDRGVVEFVIKVKNIGPDPATWVRIKDIYDPNKMTFDRAYWNHDDEQFAFTPPTQADPSGPDVLPDEHIALWKINKILRGETRELRIKFFCDIKDDLVNTAMLAHVDQFDTNPDNDMDVATVVKLDFGDAPAPYKTLLEDNGARHRLIPGGPMMGELVDVDNDGVPSDEGLGDDDLDGTDDEDALERIEPIVLVAGTDFTFDLPYSAPNDDALLNIWVDFNDDGDWDDWGEHPVHNQVLPQSLTRVTASVTIPVLPTSVNTKQTFMRFRICSNNMECNAYIGQAEDGEVEDHQAEIQSLDFGDAKTKNQTLLKNNSDGARHPITGLFLGEMIDSDPNGQPTAEADGDDTDGDFDGNGDDDDGIEFLIRDAHGKESIYSSAGNSLVATVAGNQGGYLNIWFDYDDDMVFEATGDFQTNEHVVDDLWVNPGQNLVEFTTPTFVGDLPVNANARFRLCAKPDECDIPTGKAKSGGEVEDYVVCLLPENTDLIVKSDGQLGSVTLEGEGQAERIFIRNKDGDTLFRDRPAHLDGAPDHNNARLTIMGTKADDNLFVDPDAIPIGTLMAM
ncbi:MAG: hypothetical protein HKN29_13880, partial [Rhodothermales bacterium]|nr:hypothetical protein [Rhodothermales bacterium]